MRYGRGCGVVVVLVATHASRCGDVVVVIDVAVRTLPRGHGVRPSQRESGGAVVEGCIQPTGGVVALLAGLREVRGHVVRIRRALEILQVTRHTSGAGQVVVVVDVAIDALPRGNGVRTRQNESGRRVIELAVSPSHRVVTLLAGGREPGMSHRAHCVVVVGLMATDASRGGDVVVVIDVAICTLPRRHSVRAGQREPGRRVIKACRLPGSGVVARLASLRESAAHMVRIGRALEILQVTRHAGRAGQVVVVVDMAIDALSWRDSVRTRQNESGGGVVELAIGPRHGVMTLLTCRREPGMRHRRGRVVVIVLVTTDAGRRGDVVVVIHVAIRTLPRRDRMRSSQRESSG